MLSSCFLSSFVEFRSVVSEEKSKMSQPIRGQGGHLVFPISPKNTHLVEDLKILLPVKFRWIPLSGFRGEVENDSANQRPGRPSCFSDRPEKHKLGRGCWVLASCQVLLNSVQWFQRRSQKCEKLTTDDRRTDDGQRVITIVHLSLWLRWTKNCSCYCVNKVKHDGCTHASRLTHPTTHERPHYYIPSNAVARGIWQQEAQRATYRAPEYNVPPFWRIGQGGHLVFPIGPKNTNLVEDVEILLPVKFRWIPFSGFRGEVENVSANQRPGWPSCFSDRPEKHKLGRGRWDLASWQVSLNSVKRFQRRSRKCLSQSEARAAILFFRSAR